MSSSIVELQYVQLSLVPEPCPKTAHSTTIVNMCTTDFASEDPISGNPIIDSVALRVVTQQDGCTCEVSLQNQYNIQPIYIRKYDLLTSAAPEEEACGLAVEIVYTIPNKLQNNKDPIECTKGITTRSVLLSQNGVLHLRSRIIGGNFSRGYCIQIYRQHTTGNKVGIQINCSLSYVQTTQRDKTVSSNMQTTQHMTDAEIQEKTVSSSMQTTQHMTDAENQEKTVSSSMQTTQHMIDAENQGETVASNMQTTQHMTDAAIEDNTVSDTASTLYIAIVVGSGVVVIASIVVVTIIIISRRKDNKNKNNIEIQPDIDNTDDDSDGLKYNCLYNTSEQNIMEGDYHTVELEGNQNRTGLQNFDSDYSTVDRNYSSVDIVNMPLHEDSKSDSNIKSTPDMSHRSEIQRTEEETSNNLKHATARSNAEYAIVNKSRRTDQNIKHVTAPDDINVEYAVVDKKKCINN